MPVFTYLSSSSPLAMSYPLNLSRLFSCPLCSPSGFLDAPTTLRCGHTVCSAHIASSVCPIPTCSVNRQGFSPTIPTSSGVAVFPAPLHFVQVPSGPSNLPRVDIRVNNIIQLLRQSAGDEQDTSPPDSDDEFDRDASGPSEIRPSYPPPSGPSPRSRPRPQSPSTAFDPPPSPHSPPRRINSISNFDKALAAELTCEICFMLLYQPITTPCQHVRSLAFFLSTHSRRIRHFAPNVCRDPWITVCSVPFAGRICLDLPTSRNTHTTKFSSPFVSIMSLTHPQLAYHYFGSPQGI